MNETTIRWQATITYREPIYEQIPVTEGTGTYSRQIGVRIMECTVDIEIDLASIARQLGTRAATNRSGKSVDGHVKVKRVAPPKELRRETQ